MKARTPYQEDSDVIRRRTLGRVIFEIRQAERDRENQSAPNRQIEKRDSKEVRS